MGCTEDGLAKGGNGFALTGTDADDVQAAILVRGYELAAELEEGNIQFLGLVGGLSGNLV